MSVATARGAAGILDQSILSFFDLRAQEPYRVSFPRRDQAVGTLRVPDIGRETVRRRGGTIPATHPRQPDAKSEWIPALGGPADELLVGQQPVPTMGTRVSRLAESPRRGADRTGLQSADPATLPHNDRIDGGRYPAGLICMIYHTYVGIIEHALPFAPDEDSREPHPGRRPSPPLPVGVSRPDG